MNKAAASVKGLIITNSRLTDDARSLAKRSGILLLENIRSKEEAESGLGELILRLQSSVA